MRWRADGRLDFLGRLDQQVKVRGFRIELGEVEAALAALPGVREAAAAAPPDPAGGRRLVAWVAAEPGAGAAAEPEALRAALAERLPRYAVPSAIAVVERLPRTASGKVDRKALAPPAAAGRGGAAPAGPVEAMLAELWRELLGAREVGAGDDFFALGGHSLLAVRLATRVRERFDVELPLAAVLEVPTLAGQAERVRGALAGGAATPGPAPVRLGLTEAPASFGQERLWLLDRLAPGDLSYHLGGGLELEGELDGAALGAALTAVARRHEALRTVFAEGPEGPVQRIAPPRPVPLPRIDLGALGAGRAGAEAPRAAAALGRRPMALDRGPLVRAALVRLGARRHLLALTLHHAIADGWSLRVLVRELAALYRAAREGGPAELPAPPLQPADHAAWQRRRLYGAEAERLLAFWRARIDAEAGPLPLPLDRPRGAAAGSRGGRIAVRLAPEQVARLRGLAAERSATLFMVLLAGFQALLDRYARGLPGRRPAVPVGVPVAGRERREFEGAIGFFVNTLVLVGDLAGDPGFGELVGRVRAGALAAFGHQELPFGRLVEALAPERSLAHAPLVQVTFGLEVGERAAPFPGLAARAVAIDLGAAQFDLSVLLQEDGDAVAGFLFYRRSLFERATAERIAAHLGALLDAAAAEPERPLSELAPFAPGERRQLLSDWNPAPDAGEPGEPFHRRFAHRAALHPERPAVVWAGGSRSYGELAAAARRMARRLAARGAGPGTAVGLLAERTPECLAALLGVLEAGAAYVPADPAAPRARLAAMLEDAGAVLAVAPRALAGLLPPGCAVVAWDEVFDEDFDAGAPCAVPSAAASARDLAYVLFTSGSTGRPKGVAIEHGSASRLADALEERVTGDAAGDDPVERCSLNAPLYFDASVQQLVQLAFGRTLVLVPETARRDGRELLALAAAERIDALDCTPSQLRMLFEAGLGRAGSPWPRRVLVGGEAIDDELWRAIGRDSARRRYFNLYGPTECTVDALVCIAGDRRGPDLGRPLAGTRAYVVDRALRPQPAGAVGEIAIGGAGVARGYAGRPALTAARFVPDPFADEPGARLYRSGDLARHRAGGGLVFLGRGDRQVKLRGHRIEPGEIEARLRELPGVAACAVALDRRAGRGDVLAAWVVLEPGAGEGRLGELRRELAGRLPAAMVPALWSRLPGLPLTANGKVDYRSLPAPAPAGEAAVSSFDDPVAEILAAIWSELLGRERIAPGDGFFDLGGHSLLAARLVARVRERLGVELPLRDVFEAPTLAGQAERVRGALAGGAATPGPAPVRLGLAEAPASFGQERLWLLDRLAPGDLSYHLGGGLELEGELDGAALGAALTAAARRHEALRTVFAEGPEGPVQRIAPPAPVPLPRIDLGALGAGRAGAEAPRAAAALGRRPMALDRGPLVRAALVRLGARRHLLALTLHHAIADGWSLRVLVRELAALYGAGCEGRPAELPALPLQPADHAAWQRRRLDGAEAERLLAFWRARIDAAAGPLPLPLDRPRGAAAGSRGGRIAVRLAPEQVARLRALAAERSATLFMVLLAGFQALLDRYARGLPGRRPAVPVGVPVAGRERGEFEGAIGFFVNTLVLVGDLAGDPGFGELVGRVRAGALAAFGHQELPFGRLVEALAPERSLAHAPLVQVTFGLEVGERAAPFPGLAARAVAIDLGAAQFDLSVLLQEDGDAVAGFLFYRRSLFERATAERIAAHLGALLDAAAAEPERPLSELPLFAPGERRQLLADWNPAPDAAGAPGEPFHRRFARRAELHPERPAVVWAGGVRSYGELAAAARRMARRLAARGACPGTAVGLLAERTPECLAALLGVLEAGAAYVPADPAAPRERLAAMLEDAGAALAVAPRALAGLLPPGCAAVAWDEVFDETDDAGAPGAPAAAASTRDLAYVLFTSGSTGRPKGVAIEHGSVSRLADALKERVTGDAPGDGPVERCSLNAPLYFDASVQQLVQLAFGRTLVLVPEAARRDGRELLALAAAERIDALDCTPSQLRMLFEAGLGRAASPWPRRVLVGGEAIDDELWRAIGRDSGRDPGRRRYFNLYGPTECTVDALVCIAGDRRGPDLGRPLPGARAYVVDRALRPQPAGAVGEIAIGGAGVARGYAGRPALTAARFVPDPFAAEPGARLYRSGDLARHRAGGGLAFLGRGDRQVKLRGHRIEPGEIEARLRELLGVAACAVALDRRAGRGDALAAWVVLEPGAGEGRLGELRRELAGRLPAAMVPALWSRLPGLPLTANGKVDYRSLPAPAPAGEVAAGGFDDPVAEILAAIWSELLGRERIAPGDGFFDLGGHSLLAARLVARVRERLGVELPLRDVFEAPDLGGLAARVRAGLAVPPPPLERLAPGAEAPLSPAQRSLWFVQRLEPASGAYNLAEALRLDGDLDPAALAGAVAEASRRHEALRTVYPEHGARPVQRIEPAVRRPLPAADLSALPPARREAEARRRARGLAARPFDLERGPVVRVALLRLDGRRWWLVLALHHVAGDAWSVALLMRELAALYRAARLGLPSPLAEPRFRYADYAAWQERRLAGPRYEQALAWWRRHLAGDPAPVSLAAPGRRPRSGAAAGARRVYDLDPGLAGDLRRLARAEQATLYMTLLAAFAVVIQRRTGRDDFVLGCAAAGRDRAELESMVGLFVNMLPLRAELAGGPRFRELLARVRDAAIGAYAHQELPFDRLVAELRPDRDDRGPLFRTAFGLQGIAAGRLDLEGIAAEPAGLEPGAVRYELTVWVTDPGEGGLAVAWTWRRDLFAAAEIEALQGLFERVLRAAAAAPEARIGALAADGDGAAGRRREQAATLGKVRRRPVGVPVGGV